MSFCQILKSYFDDIFCYKKIDNTCQQNFSENFLDILKKLGILLYKSKDENAHIYLYNDSIYKVFHPKYGFSYYKDLMQELKNYPHKNILTSNDIQPISDFRIIETYDYYKYDLFDYIQNYDMHILEITNFSRQIIEGINHMHCVCDIVHRDIKPENILVSFNNNYITLKFIDFDFSSKISNLKEFRGGSSAYVSPQVLDNYHINVDWKKNDIWSIGIVIYIMIFKMFLWNKPDPDRDSYYYNYLLNFNLDYWDNVFKLSKKTSSSYKVFPKILTSALEVDEGKRCNSYDLIKYLKF